MKRALRRCSILINESFGYGGEDGSFQLDKDEKEALHQAFKAYDLSQEGEYANYSPLTYQSTQVLTSRAGLGWTSQSHTAVAIPVYALGIGQQSFATNLDNTDIPKLIWETIE